MQVSDPIFVRSMGVKEEERCEMVLNSVVDWEEKSVFFCVSLKGSNC
jgi:hypothetical protein